MNIIRNTIFSAEILTSERMKKLHMFLLLSVYACSMVALPYASPIAIEATSPAPIEALAQYNTPKINRTFLGCTFGESLKQVKSRLNSSNKRYKVTQTGDRTLLIMTNVDYAKLPYARKKDELYFIFYNDRLYQISVEYSFDPPGNQWSKNLDLVFNYSYLKDVLKEKYSQYMNGSRFDDGRTSIVLTEGQTKITLVYTDKAIEQQRFQDRTEGL